MKKRKKEVWKPIKNYENEYLVSNYGRILSLERKVNSGKRTITINRKILKRTKSKDGYFNVTLNKEGVQDSFRISRLVGYYFVWNPLNKEQINHIDEVKSNDYFENIEWTTPKENVNHATNIQRRSEKQSKKVLQFDLDGNFIKEWNSTMECQRSGFHSGCISDCCNKIRKTHKKFVWSYKINKIENGKN